MTKEVERQMVDSLNTFLSVKCLFNHELGHNEKLVLGQCELADADAAVARAAGTAPGGCDAQGTTASWL